MFKLDKQALAALALAGLMAFAMSGCKKAGSDAPAEEDKLPTDPVPVRAAKVQQMTLKPSIDLVGSLVAISERTTVVSPQIAGWIEKVMVVEGDRVRAGDALLQFDARMAEADVAKAAASVDEKSAILERLKHGPRWKRSRWHAMTSTKPRSPPRLCEARLPP